MKDFGFVTEIDGVAVYRSNKDPKIEVDSKGKKLKTKIKTMKKNEKK
jgi:hypothetical protein